MSDIPPHSTDITEGVPLALAEHRAKTIAELRYDVFFCIPESLDEHITGKLDICLQLHDTSQPLILDFQAEQDQVLSVTCAGKVSDYQLLNGHLVLPAAALRAGENIISIAFIAGESSLNRNENYLYTLFVPDRASTAFPCFDQPNLKARYTLSLEIPAGWQAVANAEIQQSTTTNGRTRHTFAETRPLSTYLFAFAAGVFDAVTEQRNGRTLRMFHRETDLNKLERNAQAIFDLHASALEWLEDYTAIPYPFDKFDVVLIPSFQYAGMEHPGAILYRASDLFLERSASQEEELFRASLIAHETAHLWFGDLVTMSWFDDVWLKEVFANLMAAKIVNPTFPAINHQLRFLLAHYPQAYSVDRSRGANPIRQPLGNLKDAGSLYGAIIYHKAPIVMQQLEHLLGEQSFQVGLREYLKKFSYRNATWNDLIEIWDRHSHQDVKAWSDVWINAPGRPQLTTQITLDNGAISQLRLSQTDPHHTNRVFTQQLELFLVYGTQLRRLSVQLDQSTVVVKHARGLPKPDFILPFGYGYFTLDEASRAFLLNHLHTIADPFARGLAWLSLWEALLNAAVSPAEVVNTGLSALGHETDTQNVERMLADLVTAFWNFYTLEQRVKLAPTLEQLLWRQLTLVSISAVKTSYFRAFCRIATTTDAITTLLAIWRKQLPGLLLEEHDLTMLACELAVRDIPETQEVLDAQLDRIDTPDRQASFAFIRPALSADQTIRDNFFERLQDINNRNHEPWVLRALDYLHHPLRAQASQKYLWPSLELLEEIQRTGDIFFPKGWLDASLSGHTSPQAADIVVQFLSAKTAYPERLREKILQSADRLFRSATILHGWQPSDRTVFGH